MKNKNDEKDDKEKNADQADSVETEPKAEKKDSPEKIATENEDKDVEMDDITNHCRAEGVIKFEIKNVSKVKETALSESVTIRNLPWRIMLMPRYNTNSNNERVKSAGIFVQCDPEGEGTSWSCQAHARITLKNHKGDDFTRKISHVFFAKENDWGYSSFVPWSELVDNGRGYIKNDTISIEAFVQAEAPHGVFWDSKKLTGFVGLKNQGATCYMNSLLQTLYLTNKLRKAVYLMPTENDDINKSVALALQRVFYELQHNEKSVATKKLTKSFGWETLDSFMQHDAQELCRVLLDNMEMKMKSTVVEGTIPKLLEGKMNSYIQCTNVDYRSAREEPFYDIQLNVKGKTDVIDSFDEYIKAETLDGDNKYDAGEHGLQDAKKGVIFRRFPPVLHLHLLRFQYDPQTDTNYKINDKYAFPEQLDLSQYLDAESKISEPQPIYTLHAVLVHSGDNHGGHYVVYINQRGDGKWYKFDDDVVSQATKKEAIVNNFGGFEDEIAIRHCTNAYMLSYIRTDNLKDILQDVNENDIPDHLTNKFQEEKRIEAQRRKERSEAHLYMDVQVLTEDSFATWTGNDLFNLETCKQSCFKIQRKEKLKDATKIIAESFGYTASQCKLWIFQKRANNTTRPAFIEVRNEDKRRFESNDDIDIFYANDNETLMLAFLETIDVESGATSLPDFDTKNEVNLFFKFYDPRTRTMSYCGHSYVDLRSLPTSLFPMLCERAGLPKGTKLLFFEEIKTGQTEQTRTDKKFEEVVQDLMDGDIICYQADEPNLHEKYEIPTPVEYFKDLQHQISMTFCDKNNPNDPGFVEILNLKMNYSQIATTVAKCLDIDPRKIQFFKPQVYRDHPGNAIKCTYEGQLKDLVANARRGPKKLYYQTLTMSIDELENKIQFKCTFINAELKDERDLLIPVDKAGFVKNLLEESREFLPVNPADKLRLVEIAQFKIHRVVPNGTSLDSLVLQAPKTYRIEAIPQEEIIMEPNSILIPVMHFQKELFTAFGTPFFVKLSDGETIATLQERVREKLGLPEKEFDKIKFCLVAMGKLTYFPDEPDRPLQTSEFTRDTPQPLCLGLDHVNKAPKRTRYAYTEKAIKIHN
ncbi:ubiquitin carboxyl-terminal hydrolase 7-like [Clytia hemisphaerica]|uniref:Ubiquitin carboxyl-terminal hydrolase 7 n=1 Tax=Clytia hemisphaerica TaxID=252671 RepID=A0A7M5V1L3_9CNID